VQVQQAPTNKKQLGRQVMIVLSAFAVWTMILLVVVISFLSFGSDMGAAWVAFMWFVGATIASPVLAVYGFLQEKPYGRHAVYSILASFVAWGLGLAGLVEAFFSQAARSYLHSVTLFFCFCLVLLVFSGCMTAIGLYTDTSP
jgi:hypothetical protein